MTQRVAGSADGAVPKGYRSVGSQNTRSAATGLPTVYTSCTGITKAGQPCKANPAVGTKFCAGHLRAEAARAN